MNSVNGKSRSEYKAGIILPTDNWRNPFNSLAVFREMYEYNADIYVYQGASGLGTCAPLNP